MTCPAAYAASKVLKRLRGESRQAGVRSYDEGPGRRAGNFEQMDLDEGSQKRKRMKKTRSAYVSRFSAQAYDDLLPQTVADSTAALDVVRRKWDLVAHENEMLRAEIDRLQLAVMQQDTATYVTKADPSTYRAVYQVPVVDRNVAPIVETNAAPVNETSDTPVDCWNNSTPFVPCSEDTGSSSSSGAFEPLTPSSIALTRASPFESYLEGSDLPTNFCTDFLDGESVVAEDPSALKNIPALSEPDSPAWTESLAELVTEDSFTVTA